MSEKKDSGNKSKGTGESSGGFSIRRIFRWLAIAAVSILLLLVLLFLVIGKYPSIGAQGAEVLREIIGDKAVAGLEAVVFQVQDMIQMWKFQLGLVNPAEDNALISTPSASPTFPPGTNTPSKITSTPSLARTISVQPSPSPTFPWQPAAIAPLGGAKDEGIWVPYIQDSQGRTVAYRTFMQPDPGRPYTLISIVSIDLTLTRLHYVLGAIEPSLPGTPARPGKMPPTDRVANILLAEFNGGFQARHGQFGAMADGVEALPPREGLGTVAIYQDGEVLLGEWGTDLNMTPDMVAFRQNGPLIIHAGGINNRIYNNSPQDWGYTVNDVSPTVRSGIGLSEDTKTLFYFCGPSLTLEALAKAMQSAGVYNSIQLDINNYWVLFVRITESRSKLVAEPLLPHLMVDAADRYLTQSPRDFFYLTSQAGK
jgi:hypothetical protein